MKRKLIIALAAAMTITLGSVGVVSADDTNFAPFIPVKETPIRDGFVWIVDTPAWTEEIKHPAETEDKWIVDKPAEYEQVWVVDKEAWDEVVHHPAEYKTVHHEAEYKHHEAVYDTVHHPEEGHTEVHDVCHNCGAILANGTALEHIQQNAQNGLLWSSIFVTLMANKIGGLQFGIYRNCQISSRVFHTAVAALPLTKANRSDFE